MGSLLILGPHIYEFFLIIAGSAWLVRYLNLNFL